jgi:hypothetical protein
MGTGMEAQWESERRNTAAVVEGVDTIVRRHQTRTQTGVGLG